MRHQILTSLDCNDRIDESSSWAKREKKYQKGDQPAFSLIRRRHTSPWPTRAHPASLSPQPPSQRWRAAPRARPSRVAAPLPASIRAAYRYPLVGTHRVRRPRAVPVADLAGIDTTGFDTMFLKALNIGLPLYGAVVGAIFIFGTIAKVAFPEKSLACGANSLRRRKRKWRTLIWII